MVSYISGPGAGAYQLPTTVGHPNHDPSKHREPMYSFGTNANFRIKPLGPGPAYRIDNVTRDGNMTSPAWSFGAAFPQRSTLRTPGPGAHAPERCPPMREPRAPVYSMGARLAFQLKRPGPASNAYAIRKCLITLTFLQVSLVTLQGSRLKLVPFPLRTGSRHPCVHDGGSRGVQRKGQVSRTCRLLSTGHQRLQEQVSY